VKDLVATTEEFVDLLKTQLGDVDNPEEAKPEKYAVYIRKSTESEDKQIRSLNDQLAECREMMEREGIAFHKADVFSESKSAKESGIRSEYRRMMDMVIAGKYDGIVSWHPNRLARNMRDGGEIIDLLDKNIIKDLKFVSFTYTNDTSGKMLLGMTFVLSKQYSDHLSETVSRGIKRAIAEGKYINKAKHGYIKDKNSFLRPDGKNHELISDVFKMRAEGKNLDGLAKYLNDNDYTRTNSKTGRVYSKGMTKQKLQKILRDPIYTGVSVYGKRPIDLTSIYNFVPAVSVEDFLKINKLDAKSNWYVLTRGYKSADEVKANLLRQKVICDQCGEPKTAGITPKKNVSGPVNYFYYRCDNEDCERCGKSTRAKVILDFIKEYFEKKPFSHVDAYQHYKEELQRILKIKNYEQTKKLGARRSELTKVLQRIKDVKQAIAIETDKATLDIRREDLEVSEGRLKALNEEISRLSEDLNATKKAEMTYKEFLELFDNMAKNMAKPQSMAALDAKIQKVFLNFTVSLKNVEEYTLHEPFASLERLETTNVSLGAR
jgi:DNA invertase Pin-like site-specific DNA recombinase